MLQPAAVTAQSITFPFFFPMRSRLRRYLNIPRVRCTCSPACSARVFPHSLSLLLLSSYSICLSVCPEWKHTVWERRASRTQLYNSSLIIVREKCVVYWIPLQQNHCRTRLMLACAVHFKDCGTLGMHRHQLGISISQYLAH